MKKQVSIVLEDTLKGAVRFPQAGTRPGIYWFVLPEDINEHHQVRIFNSDRTMVYATVFTNNAESLQTTGHTAFSFAERESAQPQAIVTWFYPGSTTGHGFLYPKQVQMELAKDKHETVVAGD